MAELTFQEQYTLAREGREIARLRAENERLKAEIRRLRATNTLRRGIRT